MKIQIDYDKFQQAHQFFKDWMFKKSSGVVFTSFNHPFLIDGEISYKWKVYHNARTALNLNKWNDWKSTCGRILRAVKEACNQNVNLLERRYGLGKGPESPLYRIKTESEIQNLEVQLYSFFLGGDTNPKEFGVRFDRFAEYLRQNSLGCKWPFLAFLSFILSPDKYFPVMPTAFDKLLKFYGINKSISGKVTWHRYSLLLKLADELKALLMTYGKANSVEIQSYIWVVSYLIDGIEGTKKAYPKEINPKEILKRKTENAKEKERIGFLGERIVFDSERYKLIKDGRKDLAERVRHVSLKDDNLGYDIVSFDLNGKEIHIEVKTTQRVENYDPGFYLSDKEKQQAEKEPSVWKLYRVSNIETNPKIQNLGNVVVSSNNEWELRPSIWFVRRRTKDYNRKEESKDRK